MRPGNQAVILNRFFSAGDLQTVQVMSVPQHMGDLILPWPFGHTEIATDVPSSLTRTSSTRAASQAPQAVLTDIPHEGHV